MAEAYITDPGVTDPTENVSLVGTNLGVGSPEPFPPVVTQGQIDNPYSEYAADTRFERRLGALIVPVAGPAGTPPEIVRVHAGYALRTTKWTAERRGDGPALPSPNTNNPYEVPLNTAVQTATPNVDSHGNKVYRVSGLYTWALTVLPGPHQQLPAGKLPYLSEPAPVNDISPVEFDVTLLDSSNITYAP